MPARTRILVVDELGERNRLERIFDRELPGYEIVGASTVGSALSALEIREGCENSGVSYSYIIIDATARYGVCAEECKPETDPENKEGGIRLIQRIRKLERTYKNSVLRYIVILTTDPALAKSMEIKRLLGRRGDVWVKPYTDSALSLLVVSSLNAEVRARQRRQQRLQRSYDKAMKRGEYHGE